MNKNLELSFQIQAVKTELFAITEENFIEGKPAGFKSGFQFKINETDKLIGSFVEFVFEQEDKQFLAIVESCSFKIKDSDWQKLVDAKRGMIHVPNKFLVYFANIAVATARGALSVKTEDTKFSTFVIPILAVEKIINQSADFPMVAAAAKAK